MLEEEQLIRDAAGFPLLDQPLLQRERVLVADDAEAADLDLATAGLRQIHASSNFSSRSFMYDKNRPASAPSIRRWS